MMMVKEKILGALRAPRLSWTAIVLAVAAVAVIAIQPTRHTAEKTVDASALMQQYRSELNETLDQIRFVHVEQMLQEEAQDPAPMVYTLNDLDLAAPAPNQACFGEADTAGELAWLLEKAEPLLEGQTLYFSTETEVLPDSKIHYYMDDTILAITWKQMIDRALFTFSEVKLMHPSQFRRYLSGGEFGSGILSRTTEMSASVNAVVACSADFYAYRRKGYTILNGEVQKLVNGVKHNCYIDENGDLLMYRDQKFESKEELQAFVDENNIRFSLSFGPIIIENGENVCPKNYPLGEVKYEYPRAAICQMDKLHYIFAACNMEIHHYVKPTMLEFAEYLMEIGCRSAYALDGGQTATVVMNNNLINQVNYGSERLISDIIYFATAIPAEE